MSHPHRAPRTTVAKSNHAYNPLGTAIGLLGCIALLGAALFGQFRVRHIQVVGAPLPPHLVQTSGVLGTNIFSVRSDQVIMRLQSVRTLQIDRVEMRFPNTVTVFARARPRAVAWRSSRSLYELDPQGHIVQQVSASSLPEVTTLNGNTPPSAPVVQALHFEAPALVHSAHGAVIVYEYAHQTGLTVRGSSGWTAEVGNGSVRTLANRLATLASLLDKLHAKGKRLDFADLRYRVPYARLVKP